MCIMSSDFYTGSEYNDDVLDGGGREEFSFDKIVDKHISYHVLVTIL